MKLSGSHSVGLTSMLCEAMLKALADILYAWGSFPDLFMHFLDRISVCWQIFQPPGYQTLTFILESSRFDLFF